MHPIRTFFVMIARVRLLHSIGSFSNGAPLGWSFSLPYIATQRHANKCRTLARCDHLQNRPLNTSKYAAIDEDLDLPLSQGQPT